MFVVKTPNGLIPIGPSELFYGGYMVLSDYPQKHSPIRTWVVGQKRDGFLDVPPSPPTDTPLFELWQERFKIVSHHLFWYGDTLPEEARLARRLPTYPVSALQGLTEAELNNHPYVYILIMTGKGWQVWRVARSIYENHDIYVVTADFSDPYMPTAEDAFFVIPGHLELIYAEWMVAPQEEGEEGGGLRLVQRAIVGRYVVGPYQWDALLIGGWGAYLPSQGSMLVAYYDGSTHYVPGIGGVSTFVLPGLVGRRYVMPYGAGVSIFRQYYELGGFPGSFHAETVFSAPVKFFVIDNYTHCLVYNGNVVAPRLHTNLLGVPQRSVIPVTHRVELRWQPMEVRYIPESRVFFRSEYPGDWMWHAVGYGRWLLPSEGTPNDSFAGAVPITQVGELIETHTFPEYSDTFVIKKPSNTIVRWFTFSVDLMPVGVKEDTAVELTSDGSSITHIKDCFVVQLGERLVHPFGTVRGVIPWEVDYEPLLLVPPPYPPVDLYNPDFPAQPVGKVAPANRIPPGKQFAIETFLAGRMTDTFPVSKETSYEAYSEYIVSPVYAVPAAYSTTTFYHVFKRTRATAGRLLSCNPDPPTSPGMPVYLFCIRPEYTPAPVRVTAIIRVLVGWQRVELPSGGFIIEPIVEETTHNIDIPAVIPKPSGAYSEAVWTWLKDVLVGAFWDFWDYDKDKDFDFLGLSYPPEPPTFSKTLNDRGRGWDLLPAWLFGYSWWYWGHGDFNLNVSAFLLPLNNDALTVEWQSGQRQRFWTNFVIGSMWHPQAARRGQVALDDFQARLRNVQLGPTVPIAGLELDAARCLVLFDNGSLWEFRCGRLYRFVGQVPIGRFLSAGLPSLSLSAHPYEVLVFVPQAQGEALVYVVNLRNGQVRNLPLDKAVAVAPQMPIRQVSPLWTPGQNIAALRLLRGEVADWKGHTVELDESNVPVPNPKTQPTMHLLEVNRAAYAGLTVIPFTDPVEKKLSVACLWWDTLGSPTGNAKPISLVSQQKKLLNP